MATKWTSPVWRMPENSNQSKLDNYSLDFNGSDEFVDLGSDSTLEITTDFSISVWIKDNTSLNRGVFCCGDRSNGSGWHIYRTSANKVAFSLYTANGRTATSTTSINTGNWINVIATFEKNGTANEQIKIYVNNTLEDDNGWASAQTPSYSGTIYKQIAYPYVGVNEFLGSISQVCVFNYLLSTGQRNHIYSLKNPMAIAGPTPIAYYPLGESSIGSDLNPASNPNTLTVPNESGSGDTVFNFDNIATTPAPSFDTSFNPDGYTKLTFSIWAYIDSHHHKNTFLATFGAAPNKYSDDNFRIITNAQVLSVTMAGNNVGSVNVGGTSGSITPDGVWNLITIVYDGAFTDEDAATQNAGRLKFYTNGVYKAFNSHANNVPSSIVSTSSIGTRIAARNPTLGNASLRAPLKGKLSNAQIWNTNLSTSEIETLYNGGRPYTGTQPQAANLKGWWKLDIDTSNWDGSNWILNEQNANYTTALNFPGGTDFIDFGNGFPTTLGASATAVTAAGWVKINDLTQQQALFNITSIPSNGVSGYYGTFAIWYHQSANQLQAYIDGNTANIKLNSGITDNKWHHLALVYDQSAGSTITDGLKLYLDGDPVTPSTSVGSTPASIDFSSSSLKASLGWGWNNSFTAIAEMSNWAMWNSALTSGNITTLYNGGTPEATISLSPVSYYKLDNTTTGIQDAGSASNNGTITGSITQVDSNVSVLNGVSLGMTTANLVTSDLSRSLLYSTYSMETDGNNNYIDLGSSTFSDGDDVTFSCWVNRSSSGAVFAWTNGTNANQCSWWFDGNELTIQYGNGTAANTIRLDYTFNNNEWYHILSTGTIGSPGVGYVNGVAQSTKARGSYISANQSSSRLFSLTSHTTFDIEGKFSNFALWNRILTQDEILKVYNGGAPNDISSLSPFGWWSLSGDSYYDGSNWICPDLSTNSNNGTSSNLPVTALVGSAPGSTSNGTGANMNIPGNLQGNAPNSDKNAYSVNMVPTNRVSGSGNVP